MEQMARNRVEIMTASYVVIGKHKRPSPDGCGGKMWVELHQHRATFSLRFSVPPRTIHVLVGLSLNENDALAKYPDYAPNPKGQESVHLSLWIEGQYVCRPTSRR
jgi:hypothetical protein